MSYNITKWKTKEISNLLIPLKVIADLPYTYIELDGTHVDAKGLSEGFELVGNIIDNTVVEVAKIRTSGGGSGSTWQEFIRMLEESRGTLVAIQVWEGGDSITKLTVNNCEVVEEPVEL